VPKPASIVGRFPERELEIRRLCARDPEFRAICDDYEEAVAAYGRWQEVGPASAARAEDYRVLAEELAAEILAALDRPRDCGGNPDGD
jgi:hypothetical protein